MSRFRTPGNPKYDRDVLHGQVKFAREKTRKKKKKPLCTGKTCAKITMGAAAAFAALTQLGVFTKNTLPKTSIESMSKPELQRTIYEISNITRRLYEEIEELKKALKKSEDDKKALKKSEDDKKALLKTHNQKGIMGGAINAIKDFFGNNGQAI